MVFITKRGIAFFRILLGVVSIYDLLEHFVYFNDWFHPQLSWCQSHNRPMNHVNPYNIYSDKLLERLQRLVTDLVIYNPHPVYYHGINREYPKYPSNTRDQRYHSNKVLKILVENSKNPTAKSPPFTQTNPPYPGGNEDRIQRIELLGSWPFDRRGGAKTKIGGRQFVIVSDNGHVNVGRIGEKTLQLISDYDNNEWDQKSRSYDSFREKGGMIEHIETTAGVSKNFSGVADAEPTATSPLPTYLSKPLKEFNVKDISTYLERKKRWEGRHFVTQNVYRMACNQDAEVDPHVMITFKNGTQHLLGPFTNTREVPLSYFYDSGRGDVKNDMNERSTIPSEKNERNAFPSNEHAVFHSAVGIKAWLKGYLRIDDRNEVETPECEDRNLMQNQDLLLELAKFAIFGERNSTNKMGSVLFQEDHPKTPRYRFPTPEILNWDKSEKDIVESNVPDSDLFWQYTKTRISIQQDADTLWEILLLHFLVAILFTVGLCTKPMSLLLWINVVHVQQFLDVCNSTAGYDRARKNFLFLALFLPISSKWSIDAIIWRKYLESRWHRVEDAMVLYNNTSRGCDTSREMVSSSTIQDSSEPDDSRRQEDKDRFIEQGLNRMVNGFDSFYDNISNKSHGISYDHSLDEERTYLDVPHPLDDSFDSIFDAYEVTTPECKVASRTPSPNIVGPIIRSFATTSNSSDDKVLSDCCGCDLSISSTYSSEASNLDGSPSFRQERKNPPLQPLKMRVRRTLANIRVTYPKFYGVISCLPESIRWFYVNSKAACYGNDLLRSRTDHLKNSGSSSSIGYSNLHFHLRSLLFLMYLVMFYWTTCSLKVGWDWKNGTTIWEILNAYMVREGNQLAYFFRGNMEIGQEIRQEEYEMLHQGSDVSFNTLGDQVGPLQLKSDFYSSLGPALTEVFTYAWIYLGRHAIFLVLLPMEILSDCSFHNSSFHRSNTTARNRNTHTSSNACSSRILECFIRCLNTILLSIRTMMVILFMGMHVGMWLLLDVQLFSPIMGCVWFSLFPRQVYHKIEEWFVIGWDFTCELLSRSCMYLCQSQDELEEDGLYASRDSNNIPVENRTFLNYILIPLTRILCSSDYKRNRFLKYLKNTKPTFSHAELNRSAVVAGDSSSAQHHARNPRARHRGADAELNYINSANLSASLSGESGSEELGEMDQNTSADSKESYQSVFNWACPLLRGILLFPILPKTFHLWGIGMGDIIKSETSSNSSTSSRKSMCCCFRRGGRQYERLETNDVNNGMGVDANERSSVLATASISCGLIHCFNFTYLFRLFFVLVKWAVTIFLGTLLIGPTLKFDCQTVASVVWNTETDIAKKEKMWCGIAPVKYFTDPWSTYEHATNLANVRKSVWDLISLIRGSPVSEKHFPAQLPHTNAKRKFIVEQLNHLKISTSKTEVDSLLSSLEKSSKQNFAKRNYDESDVLELLEAIKKAKMGRRLEESRPFIQESLPSTSRTSRISRHENRATRPRFFERLIDSVFEIIGVGVNDLESHMGSEDPSHNISPKRQLYYWEYGDESVAKSIQGNPNPALQDNPALDQNQNGNENDAGNQIMTPHRFEEVAQVLGLLHPKKMFSPSARSNNIWFTIVGVWMEVLQGTNNRITTRFHQKLLLGTTREDWLSEKEIAFAKAPSSRSDAGSPANKSDAKATKGNSDHSGEKGGEKDLGKLEIGENDKIIESMHRPLAARYNHRLVKFFDIYLNGYEELHGGLLNYICNRYGKVTKDAHRDRSFDRAYNTRGSKRGGRWRQEVFFDEAENSSDVRRSGKDETALSDNSDITLASLVPLNQKHGIDAWFLEDSMARHMSKYTSNHLSGLGILNHHIPRFRFLGFASYESSYDIDGFRRENSPISVRLHTLNGCYNDVMELIRQSL